MSESKIGLQGNDTKNSYLSIRKVILFLKSNADIKKNSQLINSIESENIT